MAPGDLLYGILNGQVIAMEGQASPTGGTFASFGKGNLPTDGQFVRGLNNGAPAINAQNEVAFWASVAGGSAPHGLFFKTASGTAAVALNGQNATGGGKFNQFAGPAVNNWSQVAFYATLTGNATTSAAIFLARGKEISRVVGVGDTLFGSTIRALTFVTGLNQQGQVAFLYELADNRRGIALASGNVAAWGYNGYGQLGNGTHTDAPTPQIANVPGRVVAVAAGEGHSLAVTDDGKVYAWGGNAQGQLGNGTRTSTPTPQLANVPGRVLGVSAGGVHSLALLGVPAPSLSLKVLSVRMVSAHVLEVKTRRDFGTQAQAVQVKATINGVPVTVQQDNLTTDVSSGGAVIDTMPFDIDLAELGVPRFHASQEFKIEADVLASDGTTASRDSRTMVILLPVVLVPGIGPAEAILSRLQNADGGDHTWVGLEGTLETASSDLLAKNGWVGEGYTMSDQPTGYPTLYTLSYDRNNVTFSAGASALGNFLSLIVKKQTYADAVNLVAHSKGALVSRKYVVTQPLSMAVNQLIMCQGPHFGSLVARVDQPLSALAAVDYQNLYPLWPWMNKQSVSGSTTPFIYVPPFSTDLAVLNDQSMPSNIQYEIIYSSSLPTPYTYTQSKFIPNLAGFYITLTLGDGVVPDFSQLGYMGNPNLGEPFLQPLVPAFRGVHMTVQEIDGVHEGYMNKPEVGAEILRRVTSGLFTSGL